MEKRMIQNFNKRGYFCDKDIQRFCFHQNFKKQFNAILNEKGITSEELADRITENDLLNPDSDMLESLKKYKSGKRFPKESFLAVIAKALDVTIYDLGYPKSNLKAIMQFAEHFEEPKSDSANAEQECELDEYDFMDRLEASHICGEIIKYLPEFLVERHSAICFFTDAYLALDEDSIELLLHFQTFNTEEKEYLRACFSDFLKTPLSDVMNRRIEDYKQIVEFLRCEDFSDTEKYNLQKTEDYIHDFVRDSSSDKSRMLLENIKIYASFDVACFELLIDFLSLDNERKQGMILLMADYIYLSRSESGA